MYATVVIFLFSSIIIHVNAVAQYKYTVVAERYPFQPLLSKAQNSGWDFNMNSGAYIKPDKTVGLLVRVQNLKNSTIPFVPGPPGLATSKMSFYPDGSVSATPTSAAGQFQPVGLLETNGVKDARIAYMNGVYYLFYSAFDPQNTPNLLCAISSNPDDPNSWQRLGKVFPNKSGVKNGGAILFATPQNGLKQNYLFWGDSGISIAVSDSTLAWNDTGKFLLQSRPGYFDSVDIEVGTPPIQLDTGDFLFIYNGARANYSSVRPNWNRQYNVGYSILDGTDPTNVLQRSKDPLMTPTLEFELGNSTDYLTPDVVFMNGLVPHPQPCLPNATVITASKNVQCFFGVYGGADSDLGAVRITVGWSPVGSASTISLLSLFLTVIINH